MASELKLPGGDDDAIVGDLVKRDLVEAEGAAHFKAGGIAVFERIEAFFIAFDRITYRKRRFRG